MKNNETGRREGAPEFDASAVFFDFLAIINLTAEPFSRLYEKRYAIRLNDWRVLHVLATHGPCAQHRIAFWLGQDKMAISRSVNRLEKAGRVTRTQNPSNLREDIVDLSPAGTELFQRIAEQGQERVQRLFQGLSQRDKKSLARILDRVLQNARHLAVDP